MGPRIVRLYSVLKQCTLRSEFSYEYSQSSRTRPPWEFLKMVATRADGRLQEWAFVSYHVINVSMAVVSRTFSKNQYSTIHSSKIIFKIFLFYYGNLSHSELTISIAYVMYPLQERIME